MMKKQVSSRDLEKLSTYLDGQLNARQRTRLDARLQDDPDLAEVLSDLHRTRTILRAAPRLKAPQNYRLTPEMVGQRSKYVGNRVYAGFRMASALATLLLVMVVAGDLIGSSNRLNRPEFQQPRIIALQEDEMAKTMDDVEVPAAVSVEAFEFDSPEAETYIVEGESNIIDDIDGSESAEDAAPEAGIEAEEPSENVRDAVAEEEEGLALEESQPSEEEAIPLFLEAAPAEKSVGSETDETTPDTTGDAAESVVCVYAGKS